jgi:SAM-dependent methyltransferase
VGLDVSEAMLALCARRTRPVPLVHADLWERLPFDDASFDACLALHGTLAHPPNEEAYGLFAREVGRVVRAGGVFVVEAPAPALLARLEQGPVVADDRALRSAGPKRIVHEDPVAGVAVEALVLSESEWTALFDPWFTVAVEPLGAFEVLVTGRRRAS